MPIDAPPDQLYGLIVHELTHQFEFDIIPRGLVSSGLPLWVDEGLADFMAGKILSALGIEHDLYPQWTGRVQR